MADEIDRIDPEPTLVKLESGFAIEVVRLRTRQLFRLLRILTRGAGPAIAQLPFGKEASEFAAQLLGIMVMAIPDAEQETVAFVQSMCQPHGLVAGTHGKRPDQLTKAESEADQALWTRFNEELFNPEIDDLLVILEAVIANEAPELQALGKKIQHLLSVARKAAGLEERPEKPPETGDLQVPTPVSSTSSATSTDGQTSTSSGSPSAGSGSAPTRRARGAA